MMRTLLPSTLLGAALLTGCASQAPETLHFPASNTALTPWTADGPATVSGEAYVIRPGGERISCANSEVDLLPEDRETDALMTAKPGALVAAADADADRIVRHTRCDTQGHFAFTHLPARNWIVATSVRWGVPVKYGIAWHTTPLTRQLALQAGGNSIIVASNTTP